MKRFLIQPIVSTILFLASCSTFADEHLYQVSLLRAAPGNLPELIQQVKTDTTEQLIMRHSQGDHWDLMLLMPAKKSLPTQTDRNSLADFQHDFLVQSETDWQSIKRLSAEAGLYHIEMFKAAHGQYAGLLEQRKMENNYLSATQRNANLIFETRFGSDVDLFTLGFYADLAAFAHEPDLADDVFEKAAVEAGFTSRSDIGFYLRRFLVGHQDTLATKVK